jgi:Na+/H+ antiporter NhaD/arsenite permease-like protein
VHGGFGYLEFAAALTPVALAGLGVVVEVVALSDRQFRRPLPRPEALSEAPIGAPQRRRLLCCGTVAVGMLAAFALGVPVAEAALLVAATLLLVSGAGPKLLADLEWSLLVLFSGLFITVGRSAQAASALTPPRCFQAG